MLLIVIIGRDSLLCSSVSLLDSLNTPTTFCTLSGNLSLQLHTNNYCYIYRYFISLLFIKHDVLVGFSCGNPVL